MYVFSHLLLAAIEKKHGGLLKKVMALYLISFIDFLSSSLNQGKTRQMQIFRARFTYTRTQSGDIISDFDFFGTCCFYENTKGDFKSEDTGNFKRL